MVTDRELENLLSGRFKALTPQAQKEMAHDLLAYRRVARELLRGDTPGAPKGTHRVTFTAT